MDTIQNIVQFFQTGGTFMYPILIVFAFGAAICVERYRKLSGIGKVNKDVWEIALVIQFLETSQQ